MKMINAFWRLRAMIRKELQALLRDASGRRLIIGPVLMQLLLFPFAATMEVRNIGVVVLNEDAGRHGREIVSRVAAASTVSSLIVAHGHAEFAHAIDRQQALIGIKLGPDFSARLETQQPAQLQVVIDGRKSNAAQIAYGHVQSIVSAYAEDSGLRQGMPLAVRHLHNPNLDYQWFIVPGLVALTTTLGFLIVTALSVAREREQGTFDQLKVSPLSPAQLMAGKAVPAILIALVQATIILIGALCFYRVPLQGSLLAIYAGIVCYGLSLVGCGLLISAACRTQQQALLSVFSFLVPCILLSGFVSPVENMPQWLQWVAWCNPVQHFMNLMGIVYLKGFSWSVFGASVGPMLLIAALTLSVAYLQFRKVND